MARTKVEYEYDKDFYAWALHNAKLLRQGNFSEIDVEHIAEEIESMGRSDKRELVNRLALLIAHLLKWKFQPGRRSSSWKYTIKEQRIKVKDLLEDSPCLNHELERKFNHAYEQAIVIALTDTGLDESTFPKKCPFKFSECLDYQFLPE
jgi:Domain of unknown function DUF29